MIPDPGAFRESGAALYKVTLHRQQPLPALKIMGNLHFLFNFLSMVRPWWRGSVNIFTKETF